MQCNTVFSGKFVQIAISIIMRSYVICHVILYHMTLTINNLSALLWNQFVSDTKWKKKDYLVHGETFYRKICFIL